MDKKIRTISDA